MHTNAAEIECEWPNPENPDPSTFPDMIWASNYSRLAVQTLCTLFFAGRDYAPKCIIDGVNIQDWLQDHFIEAYRRLAEKIRDAGDLLDECVIGWDSINEPNKGYLGLEDLTQHAKEVQLRIGPTPTAFQAMRLGMGETLMVDNWKFSPLGPKRDGDIVVDPKGSKAWLEPENEDEGEDGVSSKWGWRRDPGWKLGTCIWAQHGVWDVESKRCLKPDYFRNFLKRGAARRVDFGQDYWLDHFKVWGQMIRECHPEAILFVHPPVFEIPPNMEELKDLLKERACFSTHFYDGLTLITKKWVSEIFMVAFEGTWVETIVSELTRAGNKNRTGSTRMP